VSREEEMLRKVRQTDEIASEELFAFDVHMLEVVEHLEHRAGEEVRQLLITVAPSNGGVLELLTGPASAPKTALQGVAVHRALGLDAGTK
jgi:hypothetical protein